MEELRKTRRFQGVMIVAAFACAFAAMLSVMPASATDISDDAKVLAKLDDEWSAAAGMKNVEKVGSFYAEDAVAYPPNEPMSFGREAAKKVWAAYFADASFKISWKSTHAEVAKGGDLGFTSGPYEASYTAPDGKLVNEKGKFLCVWKKQSDGTWKATHDMWNMDAK